MLKLTIASTCLAVLILYSTAACAASNGVVTKRISGCDYFMVNATNGYAVLEWYGGYDPNSGDVLIGRIEEYGMHEIVDDTADENLTVWVEDYMLLRTRALEILVDKCADLNAISQTSNNR